MDVDQNKPHADTHTCYNCQKPGPISPNCPEPQKHHVQGTATEIDIQDIVMKAVVAALGARDNEGTKAKEEAKGDF